jgi:hypothetical protein
VWTNLREFTGSVATFFGEWPKASLTVNCRFTVDFVVHRISQMTTGQPGVPCRRPVGIQNNMAQGLITRVFHRSGATRFHLQGGKSASQSHFSFSFPSTLHLPLASHLTASIGLLSMRPLSLLVALLATSASCGAPAPIGPDPGHLSQCFTSPITFSWSCVAKKAWCALKRGGCHEHAAELVAPLSEISECTKNDDCVNNSSRTVCNRIGRCELPSLLGAGEAPVNVVLMGPSAFDDSVCCTDLLKVTCAACKQGCYHGQDLQACVRQYCDDCALDGNKSTACIDCYHPTQEYCRENCSTGSKIFACRACPRAVTLRGA